VSTDNKFRFPLLGIMICALLVGLAKAQDAGDQGDGLAAVDWQIGPGKADLGTHAEIQLPDGYRFAGPRDTVALLEALGNPTSGTELGFIAPPAFGEDDGASWFVVFEFDPIGYVKDDEKDDLDADAMLASIRESNVLGNEERRKRGWAEIEVVGWQEPPNYDPQTNNLIWAIRGESEGYPIVNYNTRILGRRGVMVVSLVVAPEEMAETIPTFKKFLDGYSFKSGSRYSEFQAGDKIAKYGLTALVAGGTGVVLAKSGALKWLWKVIVIGALAVAAFFRKLFAGIFGGSASTGHES